MDLETLNEMWKVDAVIEQGDLFAASAEIPKLHNKYYNIYVKQILKAKKLRKELNQLIRVKTEWYNGSMSKEDLDARGWAPNRLKIIRADIDKYLDSDKEIIDLTLTVEYYEVLSKYLEDIIKQINNRNFIIRSMIDWARFSAGTG